MDGVLLITYVRQAQAKTPGSEEAILQAVSQRLRPVLMTALLASLGLLPAALSRYHWLGHAAALRHRHHRRTVFVHAAYHAAASDLVTELVENWFGSGRTQRRAARLGERNDHPANRSCAGCSCSAFCGADRRWRSLLRRGAA